MNDGPVALLPSPRLIAALTSLVLLLPASTNAFAGQELTVVVRVLSSGPSWGQEPIPGWPDASPVKDAPGYSLYDLEIGSDSGNIPAYLTLYKFTGWQSSKQFLPVGEFNQYRASSTIRSIPILSAGSAPPNSAQVLRALQDLVSLVLQRERATRLVIAYSGHGSPGVFFGNDISVADAQSFLAFVRQMTAGTPLILDFSTNCNNGYFDFAVLYYQYADYLIATEKLQGGFDSTDPGPVDTALANDHDRNYDKFWGVSNSLDQAFDAMVNARQNVWFTGRNSIQSARVEQSLAVYKLGEFDALMSALAKVRGFNPVIDLPKNSMDIATYVYGSNDPALIGQLERFRIRYASDRNIISWTDNSLGFSVRSPGSLQIYLTSLNPNLQPDKTSLTFAAVTTGAAFSAQTSAQTVRLTQTGAGTVTWTAASTVPWLVVAPTSGSGAATLTIATQFASGLTASQTGRIDLTLTGTGNTVGPITVTLTVVSSTAPASPPFGSFDTPAGDSTVLAGSIALTGWTLDNVGVKQVELWRDLQPGETTPPGNSTPGDPRNGRIFIANATFVDNARPDVEGFNPTTPANYRAGWGYLMLTWGLFGQGNGTYKFHAFGVDQEGNTATIGAKTVVISNNTATKPFGSIDTPAIGGDASGPNFGWGLTPKVGGAATCKIQPSGVQYSIDSGPLQPVVYGSARADIAGAFPGFSNTGAAGGHAIIDWSALRNGSHTIGWLITDDCNRADGVGSRFFTVSTGTSLTAANVVSGVPAMSAVEETRTTESRTAETEDPDPVTVARGYGELPEIVTPGEAGSRTVEVKQGERIEIRVPRGFESAYQLVTGGQRRALPTGATWDATVGTFYWQPAPGFLGPFRIVFTTGSHRISVRVIVTP